MKNIEKLSELLTDLGLSDHESKVYLASLSLGPSTVMDIADAALIKRTTVYSVVNTLMTKGLVRIEPKGFKRLFAAESPSRLETVLESKRFKLKSALPELEALYSLKGGESVIKYYEGIVGMRTAYESVLEDVRPKDYYYVFANEEIWYGLDEEYFADYRKRRRKYNLDVRLILQDTPIGQEFKRLQQQYNCQVKILPPGAELLTNMLLIPKKVIIQQLVQPLVTIIIENPSIVQMHKQMLDIMWNSLPE